MRRTRICKALWLACVQVFLSFELPAVEPAAPVITNLNLNGTQLNLRFAPYPAAESYSILGTPDLTLPFVANPNFFLAPYTNLIASGSAVITNVSYEWRITNNTGETGFYQLQVTPLNKQCSPGRHGAQPPRLRANAG